MIEKQKLNIKPEQERAILVGVCSRGMSFEQSKEYLDELAFLTETAGARAIRSYIQRLEKPLNKTYVGTGKIQEIKESVNVSEADMVIFDDDLSPSQIQHLDKELGVKVLDRSSLILHIFMERAQTAQAKAQVDLANYQYLLPRLRGMWTHLSRQKGGIGLKGAGEKEIETDRRIIRQRISHLQKQLGKIDKQDAIRRKNRSQFVRVALVGYTNVGKSTLMNLLTNANVQAENKLFATLDTTVRRTNLQGIPYLLSDTVGFIRKLPHHLVESFKSTLAEAQESDVLIHVVDAAHPQFESHMENVKETLNSLGLDQKKILTVFNKVDLLDEEQRTFLEKSYVLRSNMPSVCVSARNKLNIEGLRERIVEMLVEQYEQKAHNGHPHPFLEQHKYFVMAQEVENQAEG
ncbi:MAG: GTPase HflX [Bacteroidota bacterium]